MVVLPRRDFGLDKKEMEGGMMRLNKQQIRAILHWLSLEANRKWKAGSSYRDIQFIYADLNREIGNVQIPKRWVWKDEV